jgi:ketosteroid isomerase-like protein
VYVALVSASPAQAVRDLIDAYNARDLDALISLFADDVVWHTSPSFLWPGPYRGRDAVRSLFEHWWQGWSTGRVDIREEDDADGRAMLSADVHGRSAGSGEDVHVLLNWVVELRDDGRVALVRGFDSVEEARAAL